MSESTSNEPATATAEQAGAELDGVDLDVIESDLRDVESTLARLADGTYFADPAATDGDTG